MAVETGAPGSLPQTYAPTIGAVQLSGSAVVGGTLGVSVVNVVGYPTPVITLQWSRDGALISGATGPTYVVASTDAGHTIGVTATAINEVGSVTQGASVAIPLPPPPTPLPGAGGGTVSPTPSPTTGAGGTAGGTTGGYVPGGPADVQALLELGNTPTDFTATPTGKNVNDAWDYLRTQVEDVFSGIETSLDDVTGSSLAGGTDVAFVEVGAEAAVTIGDFPAVAFAGALLLGEYIFGWIVKKVAALFPNPSVLGWHPLGFIQTGLNNLGQALDNNAAYFGHKVSAVFITPIRQILGVFQRLGNAVVGAHNKSATIVNNNLPQARHDAVVTAQQYTDKLQASIEVAASQAAAILSLPISEDQAKWLLGQAAKNGGLAWELVALAATAIIATDQYANELHTISAQQIDAKATEIQATQAKALRDFQSNVLARLTTDEVTLAGLGSTVTTTLPTEIATQVQTAIATENQKLGDTAKGLSAQITALQTQLKVVSGNIVADENAISVAQGKIVQLQSAAVIDQQAIADQQAIITKAQVDIATSTTLISNIISRINSITLTLNNVQQAQQLNTLQLAPYEAPGAIALPVILATLTAGLNKLKTEVDTCAVQICDPTKPTHIKNVLKDLLAALSAAGEIGFLAEAIHDPIGTANTLAPFLDGIDQAAVSTLDALLSL